MQATSFAAFGLAAGLLLSGSAALAQGNPSADQIIKSLQPGPGMMGTTRGIRPVGPAPGPAPAPEPNVAPVGTARPALGPAQHAAPRAAARAPAEGPSVNLTVQFATNSAELTPAATHTLDELGRALASPALSAYRFRIEGHTDTVGSPEANKALSERRAAAVVEYLATKYQVDRGRVEAVGMGEDGLMVQTPQQVAEPRNRRVQVINLGA